MTHPIVLVTGGSRGIGAAIAIMAAQRGYDVAFSYQSNAKAAEEVAHKIRATGRKALATQADVSVEADVLRLFTTVDQQMGRLDALVNNAGMLEKQTRLDQMDVARWNRVLGANVIGTFLCAKEAVLRMSTQHGGKGGTIGSCWLMSVSNASDKARNNADCQRNDNDVEQIGHHTVHDHEAAHSAIDRDEIRRFRRAPDQE